MTTKQAMLELADQRKTRAIAALAERIELLMPFEAKLPDDASHEMYAITVSPRERDHILAALRSAQQAEAKTEALPLAVRLRDEAGPPLPQMVAQRRAALSNRSPAHEGRALIGDILADNLDAFGLKIVVK